MGQAVSGADLEALDQLKRDLEHQAGDLRRLAASATGQVGALGQLWEGPDSARFHLTWMTEHRIRLARAASELGAAAATIERNGRAQEVTSAADWPGPDAGDGPASGREGIATPELEPTPVELVFDTDYMEEFIGSENQGQSSPELNSLMEALVADDGTDPEGLAATLDRIADIRGVGRDEFRLQYERYLDMAEEAEQYGKPEPFDLERHPDFIGSTPSLRFGRVVGDVLGIDPALAALLNPSGGLVGPASDSYQPGDNDAIGYHGIFHDAAGYLRTHHRTGPGYDYLGAESFLDPKSPGTGQLSGIAWWVGNHPELDADISNVTELSPSIPGWVGPIVDGLHRAGFEEAVGEALHIGAGHVDLVQGWGELMTGDFSDGLDHIVDGHRIIVEGTVDNVVDFGLKQIDNAHDGGRFIAETAVDAVDWTIGTTDAVIDTTVDVGGDLVDSAVDTGGDLAEGVWDVVSSPVGPLSGLGDLLG